MNIQVARFILSVMLNKLFFHVAADVQPRYEADIAICFFVKLIIYL